MNIIVAILILGVIIIVHELGHFLLAKKNGITVTEFSVGMGPRIASIVKNGTRYSLKVLPFGGSCMMLGEDEVIDDEGAFHKKGVWARFSVIIGGAFFNFIFAFILALIVLGAQGVDLPNITKVSAGSPVEQKGLQEGDLITKINGSTIHFGKEVFYYFYFNPLDENAVKVTYRRDGKEYTKTILPEFVNTYHLGCTFNPQQEVAELTEVGVDSPLAKQGLQSGDIVVGINNTTITSGMDLFNYLDENPLTDKPISLTYQRDGVDKTVTISPKFFSSGYDIGWDYNMALEKVSAFNVVKFSFYELKYNIVNTLKGLEYLITGRVSVKEIAGPVGIINYVGDVVQESKPYGFGFTLLSLARFCILISANLGVMNLLPIPALDGGRLVFIIIEAIRRKPVPKEKEAMVHLVGMAALMVFMVFILFNDVKNLFG